MSNANWSGWGASYSHPHHPGPSIRGAAPKRWPPGATEADHYEIARAHLDGVACGYLGCERDACIESRHHNGDECGVADCDDCDRHFHAPARRQAAEDAREAHGDWLRDEGKDAGGSM